MNELGFYLKQGIGHITDITGFDHMLFIITLCALYSPDQWKRILLLITAFTLGHTVTLALSSLQLVRVNNAWVETLIPVTILLTSIFNVLHKQGNPGKVSLNYFLALCFGLIHGMGFSNFFTAMMMGIHGGSIALPLFGFNLGIELGQLVIVATFILVLFFFIRVLKVNHRDCTLYISGAGGGLAVKMIVETLV